MSGPLLDRIDMHVEVPRVEFQKLVDERPAEASATVRARVMAAREIQCRRFQPAAGSPAGEGLRLSGRRPPVRTNGAMTAELVRDRCRLSPEGTELMRTAMRRLGLSARGYHRVLKLARTIADLEAAEAILPPHLAEALQYRPREGAAG